jgi:hypothetical protein
MPVDRRVPEAGAPGARRPSSSRFDNVMSAVKKVLKGRRRVESDRARRA